MTMTYCLLSWGANSHGQLGQGFRSEECILPQELNLSESALETQNISKIVGGAGHTLILDNRGRVYSCGWNNRGQTGFPVNEDVLSFRKIEGKLKDKIIVDVVCGWDCSAALTIGGSLFLWGSNCFGQLGKHPSNLQWTNEPFEVAIDRRINRVSIGLRHTAVITEDHKILVAGSGSKGQLGLSPSEKEECLNASYAFTEVSTLTNIQDVSCGQHHTIAITKNGDLYAFGDNKYGQLGLDLNRFSKTSFPIKIPNARFDSSIKMNCGWSHTILLSGGQAFSWGRNTYGQLGCAEFKEPSSWKIMRIGSPSKIEQISVGSEHSVALTENGEILCWGWNEHGNCGIGHTKDIKFPEQISLPSGYMATHIGCGAGHSFAVLKRL
ncbi:secretion regulating guanine nucleotide exchange factor [Calliopsis andreniformis]|uniref:secretion regulating guanine nucleotide exchange factor n=1 Tax=Calliopsis andreniformis TaxID=337506 RepID=UPI003FCDFE18